MDYRSLRDVLSGNGISAVEFRNIALDLAETIADNHARGISHGFLSPDSVVVTADGHAQILGFGANPAPFDPQADLTALGRILFEMATGHPAVEGAAVDRIPDELRPLIGNTLARRYASAHEIVDEIRKLDGLPPMHAHPPRKYLWVIAALALVVACGIWWKRSHAVKHSDRHAITVLYFTNASPDHSLDWLMRGLPEMITLDIQQVPAMEVISLDRQDEALVRHGQKLEALGNPTFAVDIAREAGADIAVTGAIYRDGPAKVRVEVRTQSTYGGRATTFTLNSTGGQESAGGPDSAGGPSLVKLVDAAAVHLIADVMPGAKLPAGQPSLVSITTPNFEALGHLMVAREMIRFGSSEAAVKELQETLRLDPGSALGAYEMAQARIGDLQHRYDFLLLAGQHPARLPRYERSRLPVELASLGGDSVKMRTSLLTLVNTFPRDTTSRNELALRLGLSSHPNEAVASVHDGLAFDPEDATLLNQMVYAAAMSGDAAAVRAASDKYLEVHPNDLNALDTRGEAFYIVGDYEEALKAFRKIIEVRPDVFDYGSYQKMALILAEQGSFQEAAAMLGEYAQRASPEGQRLLPMYQARLAEATGDLSAAAQGYLRAAQVFNSAGRTEAAGEALLSLANVAILSGENLPRTLAAVKAQKVLGEELPATAWLQAVNGDSSGAEHSLHEYAALRPWLSPAKIALLRAMVASYAALSHKDMDGVRASVAAVPDDAYPWLLYVRGQIGSSDAPLRRALIAGRALFLPPPLESPSPLRQKLIRDKLGIKEKPGSKGDSTTIHV